MTIFRGRWSARRSPRMTETDDRHSPGIAGSGQRRHHRTSLDLDLLEGRILMANPVDLGQYVQNIQSVTGVNSTAEVIGQEPQPGGIAGVNTAFLIDDALTAIASLPGYTDSFANGVNAAGTVVGFAQKASPQGGIRSYSGGLRLQWRGEGPRKSGGTQSIAMGINSSGDIVGYSTTSSSPFSNQAFYYNHATQKMTGLNTPTGDESYATGINDQGQITGYTVSNAGTAAR